MATLPSALQQAMDSLANSRFNLIAQAKAIPEYINLQVHGNQLPNYLPTPEERQARQKETLVNQQQELERKMRERFAAYGGENLPVLQYVPDFVKAAQTYQIFKDNPYLLPQMTILETSGGKNITRPNNLLNWGIRLPYNNQVFSQMTPQEVLQKAFSGIAERFPAYEPFRTGRPLTQPEIVHFGQIYEPGNPEYGNKLWEGMQLFQNQ